MSAKRAKSQGGDRPAAEGASGVEFELEEEGAVLRRLAVRVDARRVDRVLDRAYRDLARRANIKGFRPGKAPRSVLEKYYGASLAEDVERVLVAETLPEVIEQSGIEPAGEPAIDAPTPAAGEPFAYTARIEVKPAIELPELVGLPATRPPVEVGDEDVDRELEALRERNAPLIEAEEGVAAEIGHTLRLDFVGRIDGEPFEGGTGNDVAVELGSERFIPGFEEQLVGARAGEDREVRVSFPDDYAAEPLRGKEAVFEVHVTSIQRRQVPELDDEFAKDLGDFESLAELRDRIHADLLEAAERRAKSELQRTVMDALIERTPFEVPPGMVERQHQAQLARVHRELGGQVPDDFLHAQLARMQEEGRPASERRVREVLLLEAVAAAQAIEVSEEDVHARLDRMAEAQGIGSREMRQLAHERGFEEAVRAELRDERALDYLCAQAKVEETTDT